jgi:hypothetical protein
VVSAAPLQLAVEVEVKFAPLMVRVKADPPAIVADGLKLEMVGGSVTLVTAPKAVPLALPELVIRLEMVGGGLLEAVAPKTAPLAVPALVNWPELEASERSVVTTPPKAAPLR